ncbi:hypothetical protein BDV59DRAFT_199768 [Aspergillus ambiguus]|uniref:uncharacterized protein n=1 Tax=Aspergillus ambiguus TaxID=176160 RepID=UPI003CCCE541
MANSSSLSSAGDEKKPRCQNCIDKNFDCQYGLQVTFLPKNSITVAANELQTPETHEKYRIQFVKEDPVTYNTDGSAEDSPSPTPNHQSVRFANPSTKNIPDAYDPTNKPISEIDNKYDPVEARRTGTPGDGKVQIDKSPFSDKDESAIHGLLALGSRDASAIAEGPAPATGFTLGSALSPPLSSTAEQLSTNLVASTVVSEARKLELLRHYQYHVAPWLDLSDMRRPFGLTVVNIAVNSDNLLYVLMEFSNACVVQQMSDREYQYRPSFSSLARKLPPNRRGADLNMNPTELALFSLLDELSALVSDIPTAWSNANCGDPNILERLVEHAYGTGIESVIYWMFLRLGMLENLCGLKL